jgi:hypothetical protein
MPLKFTPMASSSMAEGSAYFDDSLAMGGSLDHELIEYSYSRSCGVKRRLQDP